MFYYERRFRKILNKSKTISGFLAQAVYGNGRQLRTDSELENLVNDWEKLKFTHLCDQIAFMARRLFEVTKDGDAKFCTDFSFAAPYIPENV